MEGRGGPDRLESPTSPTNGLAAPPSTSTEPPCPQSGSGVPFGRAVLIIFFVSWFALCHGLTSPLSCRSLGMLHTTTHHSDSTPATTITSGASGANLTAFQRSAALWPLAPSKTPLQTPQQLRGTSTASHCPCSHPCRGHLMQPQQQTGLLNMLVELAEPHGAGGSGTRMVADLVEGIISPAVPWSTLNPSLHGQAPQRSQASEALPYFATIVDLNA